MSEFVLMCDTNCDMPKQFFLENQVEYISMPYFVDNQAYVTFAEDDMPVKQFYEVMRAGTMPVTSQVNPEVAYEYFERFAKQGKDILYLAFSSGLSGTYNAALLAAQRLMESYPSVRVRVVDSLCASMGEGLLLYYAIKARDEGKTLDQMVEYLEGLRLHVCHNFTVNDLFHLHRGGRVSKTSAIVGSMLGIKPVLHVDNEGHLINIGKVRGRKASLDALVNNMEKQVGKWENKVVFISHGDCAEDAQYVAELVKKRFGIADIVMNEIGASIGSHSGPGTVALFFLGEYR